MPVNRLDRVNALLLREIADDLYRVYVGKNRENHLRQEGLSRKPGYEVHPRA